MTGSEKQVEYAESLRKNFLKNQISEKNMAEEIKIRNNAISNFDGFAGDLIDCLKQEWHRLSESMPQSKAARFWREKFLG